MELQQYVDAVRDQVLRTADDSDGEGRVVAERISATIDSAVRLALLEALAAAAVEITVDLAPGSVEVRLKGRDPEFAVTVPIDQASTLQPPAAKAEHNPASDPDEGGAARITLRLPETLKTRVEAAATGEALSVNAWLVRTLTAATDGGPRPNPAAATSGQSFTGWVR